MKIFYIMCSLCFIYGTLSAHDTSKLLYVGTGIFDIIHDPHHVLIQLEYRSYLTAYKYIRPLIGVMTTSQATSFLYGGLAGDIFLHKNLVLTPSFAPGLYLRGHGKDLHFPLEFRSSIELAFIFSNQGRLGAQFYHISNASFGTKNPGTEALVFFYGFPL